MTDDLTTFERNLAQSKGWDLVPVYDTRGYMSCAILPAKPTEKGSASLAHAYVWEQAKQGCALSQRALALVAKSELAGKRATASKKRPSRKK